MTQPDDLAAQMVREMYDVIPFNVGSGLTYEAIARRYMEKAVAAVAPDAFHDGYHAGKTDAERAEIRGEVMADFKQYRRKQIAELRPWEPGEDMADVSVSVEDAKAGSPKLGDMIARNPKNHADQWLVAAAYFADNFEPIP